MHFFLLTLRSINPSDPAKPLPQVPVDIGAAASDRHLESRHPRGTQLRVHGQTGAQCQLAEKRRADY